MLNIGIGTLLTLSRLECLSPETPDPSRANLQCDRQLQTGVGAGADAYNGMLDCFRKIVANEG